MNTEVEQPLVSIVIASYNHAQYVQKCINSVIDQDYRNIELIIIDDGSADESVRCIEDLVDACTERFVRFEFRSRPNKGLSATVNEGLTWARGKYFAGFASDDVMFPGKTSTLLSHLEREPRVAGVFGGCELIDSNGALIRVLRPGLVYFVFDDLLLRRREVIVAPSQLLRVDALIEVGGYPSDLYIEDWYMWLKLTERGYRIKVIPDVLVQYRQHDSNISKNALAMYESRKLILAQFRQHPGVTHALAKTSLMAAIDFSSSSKRDSLVYLVQAMKVAPSVVFSCLFFTTLIRVMAPSFILKPLRCTKAAILRRSSR